MMPKEQEDNRDIFDKIGDLAAPSAGIALGAVGGKKIAKLIRNRQIRMNEREAADLYRKTGSMRGEGDKLNSEYFRLKTGSSNVGPIVLGAAVGGISGAAYNKKRKK